MCGAKSTKGQRGSVAARALLPQRGGGTSPAADERGTCRRQSSLSSAAAAGSQSGQDASRSQSAQCASSAPGRRFTAAPMLGTAGPARSGCSRGRGGHSEAPSSTARSAMGNSAADNSSLQAPTYSDSLSEAHGACRRRATTADPAPENHAPFPFLDAPCGAQNAKEGSNIKKREVSTTATTNNGDRSSIFSAGFRGDLTPRTTLGAASPRPDARPPWCTPSDWVMPEMGAMEPPENTCFADRADCQRPPQDADEWRAVGDRLTGGLEAVGVAGHPLAADEESREEGRRSVRRVGAGQGWFWGAPRDCQ